MSETKFEVTCEMSRYWLFCRLSGPEWAQHPRAATPGLPAVVPGLVRALQDQDADSRWFFHPYGDRSTPGIGLWFHSTVPVLNALKDRLAADHPDWQTTYPGTLGPEIAEELSTASSELALDVARRGGLAADQQLALAVLHLRELVGLVPPADRQAFLFLCWQHWTDGLAPERRTELGRLACAGPVPGLAESVTEQVQISWQHYLDTVRLTVAEQQLTGALPVNYLLFDHAHLTHRRLAITAEAEALAARLVREELSGAPASPAPITTSVPSLQTA